MTIEQKLDERLKQLDGLNEALTEQVKTYEDGTTFPESIEMNKNSYKLILIKKTVTDMILAAERVEFLQEVVEELEEC